MSREKETIQGLWDLHIRQNKLCKMHSCQKRVLQIQTTYIARSNTVHTVHFFEDNTRKDIFLLRPVLLITYTVLF